MTTALTHATPIPASTIAPAFGAVFEINERQGTPQNHRWRVAGYLKAAPPRPPATDALGNLLEEVLAESPAGKRDGIRLMWCAREEAEFVAGSGICGCVKRLDQVTVVGMVNWTPEAIAEAEERSRRHIGRLLG